MAMVLIQIAPTRAAAAKYFFIQTASKLQLLKNYPKYKINREYSSPRKGY
jgi:hypothetical protein